MGCCLSTKKPSHNDQNAPPPPPPPPIEEETVKEILSISETPKPIIVSPKPDISSGDGEAKPVIPPPEVADLKDSNLVDDAISEPARSELSSSTVTYDEEERSSGRRVRSSPGVVNSRVRPRPEWNYSGVGRNRVVGRSPNRRPDLSPARRVVPGREQHQVVTRRGLKYDPNKKDDPNGGERRSRSPAASRSGVAGGNPASIRRVSQSPGRVRAEAGGGLVKAEENGGGGVGKRPCPNPTSTTEEVEINPNESLENPLVSLECFIFL